MTTHPLPHPRRPDEAASVIVALDFESGAAALALVNQLGADASHYKVGLQLLAEAGPDLVRSLVAAGKEVFLNLKLHEIPNSVAGAVKAAGKLGASLVTVHASAGSTVLKTRRWFVWSRAGAWYRDVCDYPRQSKRLCITGADKDLVDLDSVHPRR